MKDQIFLDKNIKRLEDFVQNYYKKDRNQLSSITLQEVFDESVSYLNYDKYLL